ncbi:MAG: hypothetical protein HYV08_10450 [Deltaproteobacteria bacterium]|nr:hypothetical protein [Deltaproteobacteria bacterium]MBI3076026.1 hypothetical protein [Deltaproteobacteria bacterium]
MGQECRLVAAIFGLVILATLLGCEKQEVNPSFTLDSRPAGAKIYKDTGVIGEGERWSLLGSAPLVLTEREFFFERDSQMVKGEREGKEVRVRVTRGTKQVLFDFESDPPKATTERRTMF